MSWYKNRSLATRIALLMALALGLAAPVVADTVYTWTTEDGTAAFTDDVKHVPSRYRSQVRVRVMDSLEGYHRFTPVEPNENLHADDVQVAAQHAAEPGSIAVPVPPRGGVSVVVGGSRYGGGGVVVPVESNGSDEPMIIENRRVKPENSMATSHETVVKQGDKVIMIRRDEKHHRDWNGMVPPTDD
jgi:hypothetical protein